MDEVTSYARNTKIHQSPLCEVFRGYRESDGSPVVVKASRRDHPSPIELMRLRREYALLKSIDLPCVVRACELREVGHGLELVLEDVGESSLGALIQSSRLDLRRSLEYAVAITKVVAAVHAAGVAHKDIKPDHFVLRRGNPREVVLVDFGLATRLPRHTETLTPVAQLEGSLPYIAPEQTGRMNRAVDRRSDLYSLGVTLFELFTRRLPFPSDDPLELVHSHIARVPPAPHDIEPAIPEVLSKIVLRLLAKVAEERYQTAAGLEADLERCLRDLGADGHIAPFSLGEHDGSDELSVPQKLHGRQEELQRLLAAFDRVKRGATELLLLKGHSGIGKSALASQLQSHLVRRGYFATAKFDHLVRGVPYAPIVQICRQLVAALLAEPEETLAQRKQALQRALGPNAKLIVEWVPELEAILGPQPAVAELGPAESQNRFELVLEGFLRVFALEQPLVLVLDDLQWVDRASLRLVEVILTTSARRHLLLIGAYRDNEVDAVHPLTIALEQIRKSDVPTTELLLEPLALPAVKELVAEALHTSSERCGTLAEVLSSKTHGNPFFALQLLTKLHRDGLLRFDPTKRSWDWDLDALERSLVTDNVVEFMLARLRQLSPATQALLRIAASIGHRFDENTLADVAARARTELRACLWEALQQGVILAIGDNYRYSAEAMVSGDERADSALNATYEFLHDRVQQAAYALMNDSEKAEVHLGIGRLLLARSGGKPDGADLFAVVDHLNNATTRITDVAERADLATLNLSAGESALDAAAPASGVHYLGAALRLMGQEAWTTKYDLAFRAHFLKAQCEYLTGNLPEALRLLDIVEQHATRVLDRVAGRNLRSVLLVKTGQTQASCSLTVETARLLGMELPSPEDRAANGVATGAEFGACQAALAGRTIESLADLPPMTDPEHLALMRTLVGGFPAAFQANQEQFGLLVLKALALCLRAGTAPSSPFVYAQYGLVHLIATGDSATAYRFGKLAVEMCRRPEHATHAGAALFIFSGFLAHWRDHVSVSNDGVRLGLRISLESGDLEYATYCAGVGLYYRLFAGEPLDELQEPLRAAMELAHRAGDIVNAGFCAVLRQFIAALQGKTSRPGSLDGDDFEEARIPMMPYAVQTFAATAMTMTEYLAGNYRAAVARADGMAPLPGNFFNSEHVFYRALALAELARCASPEEKQGIVDRVRHSARTMQRWAEGAPSNHAARYSLIAAELAAVEGKPTEAMDLYDDAIRLARDNLFTSQEAVANELAARFHLSRGRTKIARVYFRDACYCYERWGATGKLDLLTLQHSDLLDDDGAWGATRTPVDTKARTITANPRSSPPLRGMEFDIMAALRASQAVVTELAFEKLIEQLMRALLENGGAQRGFLLIRRGETLRVEAAMTIDPDEVRIGLAQDLATCTELATTIVESVARSPQVLVLADASREHRFASDPYVRHRQPKSVLCVPMVHRGSLTGILYLENNLATSAFTPARTELLQFLAGQAAAALENSRLYSELTDTTERLRRTNETLESQVAARTEELRRALGEVWSEMDLARKIQTVLLPKSPRLPDYEIAAAMIPAADVGGDYYDVISNGTGGVGWLLIGDVSGHGVTAGLIMMMIQSAVRAVVLKSASSADEVSPASVLAHVNACLWNNLQQIGEDQYMTITALKFDGGQVTYAGLHQDLLVYRASAGRIDRLETNGAWIGVLEDLSSALEDSVLQLELGDVLLLFSDGLTEMKTGDDRRLEVDGLVEKFRSVVSRTTDPAAIVQGILGPLTGKALQDDVTLVAVRYAPSLVH